MIYRAAADLLVLLHLLFVLFVVLGGLLVLRKPRMAWLHLPAVLWGVIIEFTGCICPLTPLEKALREAGGEAAHSGGFINHYIAPVLYPAGLTTGIQLLLGVTLILLNTVVYGRLLMRRNAGRNSK